MAVVNKADMVLLEGGLDVEPELDEEEEQGPETLSDDEVVAICQGQQNNSEGEWSDSLSGQMAAAMNYYYGESYGNEEPGSSNVVTREVMDTIEWIKPELIKLFASGTDTVRFEPQNPNDVQASEQATSYVNYLFNRKNPGFKILYQWLNDGLLQKNGIVKVYYDQDAAKSKETYEGLTEMELNLLLSEDDVELVMQEEVQESQTGPNGQMAETLIYNVTINRIGAQSGVRVENIPPEEFLIDRSATSIADSHYCAHRTLKTISELKVAGYDVDIPIGHVGSSDEGIVGEEIYLARHDYDNTGRTEGAGGEQPADDTMREVWVYEHYIKMDYDGDGIAELRKITITGSTILDNEEIDEMPFAGWTPIIISHKFYGLSMADLVMDLQRIQSQLFRNMLDNQYLANNGRYEVIDGMVEIDDLLTSTAHGVVRTKMAGAVKRLDTPQLGPTAFQFLEYVDRMREKRTGVSERTQGLDPNSLAPNTAASAVSQVMTAAQQRVELIARVFGETGLTDMFRLMYKEVIQNQTSKDIFRLNDQYVEIDPSEWRERKDVSCVVGLGNGSKDSEMMQLNLIFQNQQQLMANPQTQGLVNDQNVYNTLEDQVKVFNKAAAGRYFTDPASPQAQQAKQQQAQQQQAMQQMQEQMTAMQAQLEQQKVANDTLRAQSDQIAKTGGLQVDQQEAGIKQQAQDLAVIAEENDTIIETAELSAEFELEKEQKRGVALGD